jgi:hypothetical protein
MLCEFDLLKDQEGEVVELVLPWIIDNRVIDLDISPTRMLRDGGTRENLIFLSFERL